MRKFHTEKKKEREKDCKILAIYIKWQILLSVEKKILAPCFSKKKKGIFRVSKSYIFFSRENSNVEKSILYLFVWKEILSAFKWKFRSSVVLRAAHPDATDRDNPGIIKERKKLISTYKFRRTQKHTRFPHARRRYGDARGDLLWSAYDRYSPVRRSEHQYSKLRPQEGGHLAQFNTRRYRGEINFGIE